MFHGIVQQLLLEWHGRLRNVRAELVSIGTDCANIQQIMKGEEDQRKVAEAVASVASNVAGVCGILVRIIDSLKGQKGAN